MLTVTADKVLPCTVTGSWPRPRWFDVSMWGKPLDTCMMDVRFREKFGDALALVVSEEERAGLDILTHGENGMLAGSEDEWVATLTQLLDSREQREALGRAGRRTVVERYSADVQAAVVARILRQAAALA